MNNSKEAAYFFSFFGQVHQTPQGTAAPTEAAGYGYNQQGYYQGYQQQPAQAASYGDPATTYAQQSYPQQAYAQPVYSGYSYAQPTQGDQQAYGQQGQQGYAAYGQSQAGYSAPAGDGPAPAAASGYDYNASGGGAPAVPVSQPPTVSATQS